MELLYMLSEADQINRQIKTSKSSITAFDNILKLKKEIEQKLPAFGSRSKTHS